LSHGEKEKIAAEKSAVEKIGRAYKLLYLEDKKPCSIIKNMTGKKGEELSIMFKEKGKYKETCLPNLTERGKGKGVIT